MREKRSVKSNLRPGTKGFTCRKRFIGYNFGSDYGAESEFGTHKELIVVNVVNISKYRYCVNKSLDISDDRFAKTV